MHPASQRTRLPPVVSVLFTLAVAGLAVVVLYGVASAVGVTAPAANRAPGAAASGLVASVGPGATVTAGSTAASASPASAVAPLATSSSAGASGAPPSPGSPASALPSGTGSPASAAGAPSAATSGAATSGAATPPTSSSLVPPAAVGPFAMDLYRRADFVSEMDKVSCVPAAMQTMINIMSPGADTSVAMQKKLYSLARKLSPKTLKGPGAEPEGWAAGLTQLGYGPYLVDVQPSRTAAIKAAARALRLTGRPVGLLAWRGAHSWVMSGFKATADPALTDNFKVTAVNIEDVWYPRVSSIWGASRPPDTLVAVSLLPEDLFPWHRPTGPYPGKDGKYVLVLPAAG
jgi:hypothetical protein